MRTRGQGTQRHGQARQLPPGQAIPHGDADMGLPRASGAQLVGQGRAQLHSGVDTVDAGASRHAMDHPALGRLVAGTAAAAYGRRSGPVHLPVEVVVPERERTLSGAPVSLRDRPLPRLRTDPATQRVTRG